MKAIVIGRHNGEIPGVEVISKEIPTSALECIGIILPLIKKAHNEGCAVLFQALPLRFQFSHIEWF